MLVFVTNEKPIDDGLGAAPERAKCLKKNRTGDRQSENKAMLGTKTERKQQRLKNALKCWRAFRLAFAVPLHGNDTDRLAARNAHLALDALLCMFLDRAILVQCAFVAIKFESQALTVFLNIFS